MQPMEISHYLFCCLAYASAPLLQVFDLLGEDSEGQTPRESHNQGNYDEVGLGGVEAFPRIHIIIVVMWISVNMLEDLCFIIREMAIALCFLMKI